MVGRVFRGALGGLGHRDHVYIILTYYFLKALGLSYSDFQIEVSTSVSNCGGYKWVSFDLNFIERVRERQGEREVRERGHMTCQAEL